MNSEKNSFESRLRGSNLNIVIISDPQTAKFDFVHLIGSENPSIKNQNQLI